MDDHPRPLANAAADGVAQRASDGSIRGRSSFLRNASFFVNSKAGNFEDFLLATSKPGVKMITRELWRSIDELIITPIEKPELRATSESGRLGCDHTELARFVWTGFPA